MHIFDFLYLLLTKTLIFIHNKMLLINKVCEECILNGFHKFNCIERKKRNKHECLKNRIIVLTSNLHAFKNIFFQNNAILRIKIFHYIIHFTGKTILKNSESRKKSGEAKVNSPQSLQGCGKEKNSLYET